MTAAPMMILLACSGHGAQAAIERHLWFSLACAGIGIAITVYLAVEHYLYERKGWTFPAACVLMLLHPAWWISAQMGDCGHLKFEASCVFAVLLLALAIRAALRPRASSSD